MTQKTGADANLAGPPGGGRQDHDVMREAAVRPVSGPASVDTLAAGGGLEVPGREVHAAETAAHGGNPGATSSSSPSGADGHHGESTMIPGERDASTLTHREAGAIGGQFTGADIPAGSSPAAMDDRTTVEHAREGGGIGVKPHKHR